MGIELEDVSKPTVLTKLRVLTAADLEPGSRLAMCLRTRLPGRPAGPIVLRTGVASETATFRETSGQWLHACDDVAPATDRAWCGGASGRLFAGRLRDPRLRLAACSTSQGEPVAFAWIEPSGRARYLVVSGSGYAEAFETAGGLPIRISTAEQVDFDNASASVEVSEHAASGDLLRTYTFEAQAAG